MSGSLRVQRASGPLGFCLCVRWGPPDNATAFGEGAGGAVSRPGNLNVHLRGKSMNTRSFSALLTAVLGCVLLVSGCDKPSSGNGQCKTLASDNSNCGACGTACGSGRSCQNGTCTCASGLFLCSGSCVASDAQHCGGCNACPTGQVCSGNSCMASCPTGQTMCAGGACVPASGDGTIAHCGGCNACPTGATACTNGTCGCAG